MTDRWRNWGMDCEDGKLARQSAASQRLLSLFSWQSKILQNPLLMDCLPKEGRQEGKFTFSFCCNKIIPPLTWDFLGVREICAECWRREFQGKFSFVFSQHVGTMRKHFLGSSWNFAGKWILKRAQTGSDGVSWPGLPQLLCKSYSYRRNMQFFSPLPATLGRLATFWLAQ